MLGLTGAAGVEPFTPPCAGAGVVVWPCAGCACLVSICICLCLICSGVGAGAGGWVFAAGAFAGALVPLVVSRIDLAPSLFVAIVESVIEVTMKIIAATVVILERNEAGPRLPKAVCVAPPPNALAKSAPLPD